MEIKINWTEIAWLVHSFSKHKLQRILLDAWLKWDFFLNKNLTKSLIITYNG